MAKTLSKLFAATKIIICNYQNYLNRYQYVQINDQKLTQLPMFSDVLKGSVLGPVLFNLYLAELGNCMSSTSTAAIGFSTVTTFN